MKKVILVALVMLGLAGCSKDDLMLPVQEVKEQLQIKDAVGIKLESAFVTTEVAMNVKMETSQTVTIRIFDIANKVVSKETMTVKAGDNILKIYTSALPSSAYRIGLFDSNNKQLGITDFNKL
jgi:hypothetical protein